MDLSDWVRKNCKFAVGVSPRTPSALEPDPLTKRLPETPDEIDIWTTANMEAVRRALFQATRWMDMIGKQKESLDESYSGHHLSAAHMLIVSLKEALEAAKKLQEYSNHQRQVLPGESARLGSNDKAQKLAENNQDSDLEKMRQKALERKTSREEEFKKRKEEFLERRKERDEKPA